QSARERLSERENADVCGSIDVPGHDGAALCVSACNDRADGRPSPARGVESAHCGAAADCRISCLETPAALQSAGYFPSLPGARCAARKTTRQKIMERRMSGRNLMRRLMRSITLALVLAL